MERAVKLPSTILTMQLVHNQHGQRYMCDAFNSAWDRAMTKAVELEDIEPFRFHDLKRKGTTDAKGDKLAASGHKSPQMLPVYDVSVPEVAPTR